MVTSPENRLHGFRPTPPCNESAPRATRATKPGGRDVRASAVRRDADLPAHVQHRAGGALRADAGADVLAEGDEQGVDLDPVAAWQLFLQRGHGLFRRPGGDVAPAVGDAVDVNIDADVRLLADDAEHEVSA